MVATDPLGLEALRTQTLRAPLPGRPRRIRTTRGYRVFQVVNAIILTGVVVVTLFPFVNILARSFSETNYVRTGQVSFWPRGFNLTTYKVLLEDPWFWTNYRNTVLYTVVATAISMVLTTCFAYVLSKKDLKGRGLLVGIAMFTLFFNGGLIPNFVLVSSLGLRNSLWAVVLPNAINVFNLLVMKAFFEGMPTELEEAAAVDGLNTYGTLWRIVLPLSKAVLATMTLFYAVTFWNSWFPAFLYMDHRELFPVTVYLRNLVASATTMTNEQMASDLSLQIEANVQAVAIILVLLPISLIYPFVQRYFVSSVLLGAVKG